MPLPLIPILLGAGSLFAGAVGAVGISEEKGRIEAAEKRVEKAKSKYEGKKKEVENAHKECNATLAELGKIQTEIRASFSRFEAVADKLNKECQRSSSCGSRKQLPFTTSELNDLRHDSMSAMEVLGVLGGGTAAGGFAVAGAWALVGLLGSASTGTALSALSGAALTNGTLAWFGGGSLAAGGLGMMGGMATLGGLFLGPAVLISALCLSSKADEAQSQASKVESEVDESTKKMDSLISFFEKVSYLARCLQQELKETRNLYLVKIFQLESLVERRSFSQFSEEDELLLSNTYMLVKVLEMMAKVALCKKDGKGEPIMEIEAVREQEVFEVIHDSEAQRKQLAA